MGTVGTLATYGFVTYRGMRMLLESAASRLFRDGAETAAEALRGAHFLDLGSGDGRAAISAAFLVPDLAESFGLELSASRHALAEKNWGRLPERLQEKVRFQHGDMLQASADLLSSADIIYLANLRFPEAVVVSINERLDSDCALERDAIVATLRECPFSRPHDSWTLELPMSWNPAGWPVFFYHLHALQRPLEGADAEEGE